MDQNIPTDKFDYFLY